MTPVTLWAQLLGFSGLCLMLSSCFTQMTQVVGVGIHNENPEAIMVKHYVDDRPIETYLLAPKQLHTVLLYPENQAHLAEGNFEVTNAQGCRIDLTSKTLRELATRAPQSHFWIIHITPQVFTSCVIQ